MLAPSPEKMSVKPKIRLRKKFGSWYVLIPGDMPEFVRFTHWTDAVAKIQLETKEKPCKEDEKKRKPSSDSTKSKGNATSASPVGQPWLVKWRASMENRFRKAARKSIIG